MKFVSRHKYLKWILLLGVVLSITAGLLYGWNNFLYSGVDIEDYAMDQQLLSLRQTEQSLLDNSSTFKMQASSTYPEKYQTNFGILLYHRVTANPKFKNSRWSVTPDNFENQIKYLQDQGYSFVKMTESYQKFLSVSSTTSSPYHKTLAITFDDGYRDVYTTVLPLLKKYNIPATVFVITKDVGKNGNVTWEMLKEMVGSGLVEVGSHSVSHKYSTKLSKDTLLEEFAGSKAIIEEKLGSSIFVLAYPYGAANAMVYEVAKQAGYLGAVRVMAGGRPAAENFFAWRRVAVDKGDYGPLFLKKIFTAFGVIK
jgi:peptidoglycan/xylan/chitin deacetylase (PgdA/CDA1 family)